MSITTIKSDEPDQSLVEEVGNSRHNARMDADTVAQVSLGDSVL